MTDSLSWRLGLRPLLAVLALALGMLLASATGQVRRAAAAEPACAAGCTIEIEFKDVMFPHLDDSTWGAPSSPYAQSIQAYGSLAAATWKNGVFGPIKKLKLAGWGKQPASCPSYGVDWNDSQPSNAKCFRSVSEKDGEVVNNSPYNPYYAFDQTFLCAASTNATCSGTYKKNNNRIRLTVKPGELLMVGALIYDYDSGSGDDVVCDPTDWLGPFTASQLATLSKNGFMSTPFNGDGSCEVTFTAKRVY